MPRAPTLDERHTEVMGLPLGHRRRGQAMTRALLRGMPIELRWGAGKSRGLSKHNAKGHAKPHATPLGAFPVSSASFQQGDGEHLGPPSVEGQRGRGMAQGHVKEAWQAPWVTASKATGGLEVLAGMPSN